MGGSSTGCDASRLSGCSRPGYGFNRQRGCLAPISFVLIPKKTIESHGPVYALTFLTQYQGRIPDSLFLYRLRFCRFCLAVEQKQKKKLHVKDERASRVGKWKISRVKDMGNKKRVLRGSDRRTSERERERVTKEDDEDQTWDEM